MPLLETFRDQVFYNEEDEEILLKTFDQNKSLIILAVAGNIGVGKSTWLNSLIYEFTKGRNDSMKFGQFKSSKDSTSVTNGFFWSFRMLFSFQKSLMYNSCSVIWKGREQSKSKRKKLGVVLKNFILLYCLNYFVV